MMSNFITRNRQLIVYGSSLAVLLLLLKAMEYRLLIIGHAFELYLGVLALLFTGLGIWLAVRLAKPRTKTIVVEKTVMIDPKPGSPFLLNEAEVTKLNISNRELEVLRLMSEGMSNQEIADKLYVSPNTVKTHLSNVFGKMQVSRRTQAIEMGRRLRLIP